MGKIVVSDNASLDGVIQDPAGDEGFRLGCWVGQIKDRQEVNKLMFDEALGTEALLLGRRSYEWFAARWPSRSGELADRINSLPKYVVSSTLEDPDWNDSTVLKGDVVTPTAVLSPSERHFRIRLKRPKLEAQLPVPKTCVEGGWPIILDALERGVAERRST